MKSCLNCGNKYREGWCGIELCCGCEMAETVEEMTAIAEGCSEYVEDSFDERYCIFMLKMLY